MCSRRRRRLATLFVSGLMLSGCAGSRGNLNVDLQAIRECQKLGGQVAVPDIGEDSDYRVIAAQALGQLNKANVGAAKRTICEGNVIDAYSKAN